MGNMEQKREMMNKSRKLKDKDIRIEDDLTWKGRKI